MVKHVVMWRYEQKEHAIEAQKLLDGMTGRIPALLSIETGIDFTRSAASCDLVLITTHTDRNALDTYQNDPLHREVSAALGKLKSQRFAVDFEV